MIIYNKDMRSRDYETIKINLDQDITDFTILKNTESIAYRGGGLCQQEKLHRE